MPRRKIRREKGADEQGMPAGWSGKGVSGEVPFEQTQGEGTGPELGAAGGEERLRNRAEQGLELVWME